VNKSIDIVIKLNECTITGDSCYLALDHITQTVQAVNIFPRILGKLLHTQGNTLILNINLDNNRVHFVALLNHFTRMVNFTGPAHIRNMNHPVNAFFEFHKSTIGCKVSNLSADTSTWRIIMCSHIPWIYIQLSQTEGNLLVILLNSQNNSVYFVPNAQNFARLSNSLCPGHFCNMNKTFDSLL